MNQTKGSSNSSQKYRITKVEGKQLLDQLILGINQGPEPDQLQRNFKEIIMLLTEQAHKPVLSQQDVSRCIDLAYTILNILHIPSLGIHGNKMYLDLQVAKAGLSKQKGDFLQESWNLNLASHGNDDVLDQSFLLTAAENQLRLSRISSTKSLLERIDLDDLDQQEYNRVLELTLTLSIFTGENLFEGLLPKYSFAQYVAWYRTVREAVDLQDLRLMLRETRKDQFFYRERRILHFQLWAHAIKTKRWQKGLVRIASLKKRQGLEISRLSPLTKFLQVLEECYDYEIPLVKRLEKLGQVLGRVDAIPHIEDVVLIWAASARFLMRSRVKDLANLCLDEYGKYSQQLSLGKTDDVLKLFES